MTVNRVKVETKIPGGLLGSPEHLVLEFPLEETLTVKELIRLKVEEEARRLAALETLGQPAGPGSLGREYQDVRPAEPIDLAAEVYKAQQAFSSGRFVILVNGRRYTRLDEQVTLAPQTTVKFIRLMPLRGG
jgi:hypothetical protein